ncbi:polysaccharide lyase family 7 protein [Sinorhizobium sp. BJ1]|uniref:polysaccharide lyase family 7 protein n=1 Tax=Sinorhizobium sp. BJ1 TaxID=2035455 RepID=UPI000BE99642|nr:polysaccharide lyase family 7 protein [Sinorhizobium sp. BJ1]PDT80358.1 hypothetical protein CO676_28165 [Sinorhizobium sp. BJ1]
MTTNSDNFDLTTWKLCLPIDEDGGTTGTAFEILDLSGFEHSRYFYSADDGAMVFRATVDGAITKDTTCARSELREMDGTSLAAWTLAEGGTMTATLKIDEAPQTSDGEYGRIVLGQVHGSEDELVRLYWENGEVYFKNDQAGENNEPVKFVLQNAEGESPDISVGEVFSYKIDVQGDALTVVVYADGDTYTSVTTISAAWADDEFYFKAGIYLGTNQTNSTGSGQVSFYGLDFSHVVGEGLDGLSVSGASSDSSDYAADTTGTIGNDVLAGGTRDDVIYSYGGDDVVRGGDGADKIFGGAGADKLVGQGGADVLYAGLGDDTVYGGDGDDTIVGGAGNDTLKGEVGADVLSGGDGDDTFYGGDGDDYSKGEAGADRLDGGNGADTLYGQDGNDTLLGQAGNDRLDGGTGDDTLYGYGDDDRLYGGDGADKLIGGEGADTLYGGAGNDKLYADEGADNLYGGSGADSFIFKSLAASTLTSSGRDDVYQFSQAEGDTINLASIDANALVSEGQAFKFIGTDAFSSKAGELRYVNTSSETYIYGDVNGDGAADFSIHVDGVFTLQGSDFVL